MCAGSETSIKALADGRSGRALRDRRAQCGAVTDVKQWVAAQGLVNWPCSLSPCSFVDEASNWIVNEYQEEKGGRLVSARLRRATSYLDPRIH